MLGFTFETPAPLATMLGSGVSLVYYLYKLRKAGELAMETAGHYGKSINA